MKKFYILIVATILVIDLYPLSSCNNEIFEQNNNSLFNKKRIFVTGAAGFIGFHVASKLAERGDEVLGYDNFNNYYDPQLKRDREKLLLKNGVSIIKGDICDITTLESIIEQFKPTHIVHLAAQCGVRYSLINPHSYLKTNIIGFINILEVCSKIPGIKLIYASSSSVYGRNKTAPFSIDDSTDHQASVYGVTKKTDELLADTYHHLYGISVTGLRFFTVYGPWGRPDMAYFTFTDAIVNDKPVSLYHNGILKRDFTYIDDIVAGTIAAIDLGSELELFNLGNNNSAEVNDLVEIIEKLLGKKAIRQNYPMQQGDVFLTYADISHSVEKLNFSPQTSLKDGMKKFMDWYREYYLSESEIK